jgi:transcriptional regulator with XRE-family HTH domain
MADKMLTPAEIAANRAALGHVKNWLRFRDVSQRKLAELMNVSEPTVSKWLKGTQAVTIAQFSMIAKILNADPSELLAPPADRERSLRLRKVAEVALSMQPEALDEWVAVGRRISGAK